MKLSAINTGSFKLDGGAMFGVVPKKIWQKLVVPDAQNLCTWAMRCLLVETGNRKILIDTGMGSKQDARFFSHYEPTGNHQLENSLALLGIDTDDITDVFLTHLHFDHCGGAVSKNANGHLVPTFGKATYWSNQKQWHTAMYPNAREKASFLKENFLPLQEHGVLKFLNEGENFCTGFKVAWVYGHTQAMMLPILNWNNITVIYGADLLPSAAHLPTAFVMAYDTNPLISFVEKEQFLTDALAQDAILFFEHDLDHECCTLQQTEKGIRPKQFLTIDQL